MLIRAATPYDALSIVGIYNYYIENSIATFVENAVSENYITENIAAAHSQNFPYLVAELGGEIVGYAYASRWKNRSAYRFSAETTVYLAQGSTAKGIGSALYEALFVELRLRSYHTVLAGISLPNDASIALHEKFGMEKVAHLSDVGYKFDKWVDVGYWQKNLINQSVK